MKLSDYVLLFLENKGVKHAFTLTGGGIMHLVDSLGNSSIKYICCHHEQAASIAAQAYGMYDEKPCLCLITTGPGGTNAITGTAAAYMDSTPVIYISGQVKRSDFASLRGVRQYGAQENDIISMVKSVTKYAVLVTEPDKIAFELEKAWHIATTGRKGPVWIDIPLDVQASEINEEQLVHFRPEAENIYNPKENDLVEKNVFDTVRYILHSQRPVVLLGHGAVSSRSYEIIREIINITGIPVLTTWRAPDFMGADEPGFYGSPGLQAPRYSNLILQTCDLLIVLGSRLDNMVTAFSEENFAFRAKKIIVDIDENEISKFEMPGLMGVVSDIKLFVGLLHVQLEKNESLLNNRFNDWRNACDRVKEKYPLSGEKQAEVPGTKPGADLYRVTEIISRYSDELDILAISSTSRCNTAGHIAFRRRRGQKSVSSMGMGSMGFALPSAIGAYYASEGKRVIMLEGDGSLQLNIQEFITVVSYKIPVKMFIFSNRGYAAITTMQDRNFNGHYVGSNERSGLFMPDLGKIAYAYGIPYNKIEADDPEDTIKEKVSLAMDGDGAYILDIVGSLYFDEIPKCISSIDKKTGNRVSAALENPYPFLSEEDLQREITDLMGV